MSSCTRQTPSAHGVSNSRVRGVDDEYVPRSVVRALRDGYPRIEYRFAAPDFGNDAAVDRAQVETDAIDNV
ncbi:hypothetical protein CK500_08025 [Halorubrum salipaludis]|uniref:Uncharacterized protein n=1 Tax=Halorubrum salipaludis TaxID=2032630 RepID=A0A2A2FI59_9EURY|nr:hypothetical protein CK500_08025 [Halorubrum salipaludis]